MSTSKYESSYSSVINDSTTTTTARLDTGPISFRSWIGSDNTDLVPNLGQISKPVDSTDKSC